MQNNSSIFIIPGLGNSGEQHWQTLWEKRFGFKRIQQDDWETPHCDDWIERINNEIPAENTENVILIGHSLSCITIAYWAQKYGRKIKGALLVAPSDTEAATYPSGTTGFVPVPTAKLPFPTITVASTNDYYVTFERAKAFADAWGSKLVSVGDAGHINVAAGFGEWEKGLELLKELDLQEAY